MEKNVLKIQGTIETYRRRRDGSLSIVVETQELHHDVVANIAQSAGRFGWFVFSPNDITIADIPKEEAQNEEGKTKAQRMRGRLYVLWQKRKENNTTQLDADSFYNAMMEKYLEDVSEKINAEQEKVVRAVFTEKEDSSRAQKMREAMEAAKKK